MLVFEDSRYAMACARALKRLVNHNNSPTNKSPLQFLWILLCMALVGNMLAITGGPSVINYDMFVAVFCMLALFYLTLVSVKESFAIHPIFPLVLDALCTLFTLIAGIATAAYLRVHSCSNRVSIIARLF